MTIHRPSPVRMPRSLVRAWTRIRRAVQPQTVDFVYTPAYRVRLRQSLLDRHRAAKVLSYLHTEGLIGRRTPRKPEPASLKNLTWVHTDAYLDSLHTPGALTPIFGAPVPDDQHQTVLDAQRYAVGGTRHATELAIERQRTVVNLGGGFHHARPDAGRGFCIFNDVAVAIHEARRNGFEGRILVIDLDLHDGDGTRAVFAEDPSVFTFSIHNRHWDDEPAVSSLSIELPGEVDDSTYLESIRNHLPKLLRDFAPELVYYLAGTDPAADDPLGNWRITQQGMLERDRYVIETTRELRPDAATVILLAGGYGQRTWRYTARFLAWLLSGGEHEPPTEAELVVARYRRIFEHLRPEELTADGDEVGEGTWDFSAEDIYGDLMGPKRSTRLLGLYSQHGVELVLERSGFFDRLRELGYPRPYLDFDLEHPAGETVRIYGNSARRDLLIELRVRRDAKTVPGRQLLSLEWLLMQNPRETFATDRNPLPGQKHPGLGLLNDMMALLILICEQSDLEGMVFVPSHFHLAAKGRKYLRFLSTDDAAWYRAVRRAVTDLSLRRATQAVADGRIIDPNGEPVPWRPMPMLLPISDSLKERVDGDEYWQAIETAESAYCFTLKTP